MSRVRGLYLPNPTGSRVNYNNQELIFVANKLGRTSLFGSAARPQTLSSAAANARPQPLPSRRHGPNAPLPVGSAHRPASISFDLTRVCSAHAYPSRTTRARAPTCSGRADVSCSRSCRAWRRKSRLPDPSGGAKDGPEALFVPGTTVNPEMRCLCVADGTCRSASPRRALRRACSRWIPRSPALASSCLRRATPARHDRPPRPWTARGGRGVCPVPCVACGLRGSAGARALGHGQRRGSRGEPALAYRRV